MKSGDTLCTCVHGIYRLGSEIGQTLLLYN